ncbi:uroporphyrinogen-III synthase [Georgenia subflava]|uniref:Uroporphyrinogen-III synthase n=1 Tax=Georgenia subflava TaxID=1622177 RepID=A0A6N7EIC4_9MICO|nr:uroporphyrinogen-III synthase [Georgenia subflava]MPV37820.1 uroporphyrinogen-III synthase [Georgenia subflava]
MSPALTGRRVLVPRMRPDDPIVAAVRATGADVLPTALVTHPVVEPATGLDEALTALGEGAHSWLAVTSATTVQVLVGRARHLGSTLAALVGNTPVAAVGPATATAVEQAGVPVALMPPGPESSAAALAAVWPPAPHGGIVLLPRSVLAAPTLATGLRERGWLVDDVVAYRTLPASEPDPAVARALAADQIDAVVLTSGSTVAAFVDLYGPPTPKVRLCAIGGSTAAAAAAAGLTVHAVATEQTPTGLAAAVVDALARDETEQQR